MTKIPFKHCCILLLLLSACSLLTARQKEMAGNGQTPPPLKPHPPVTTSHEITLEGRKITYDATVGYLRLVNSESQPQAYFFFTAYRIQTHPPSVRPLTFCFNGGPGASSFYLHLLTIGPRRALLNPDGHTPAPPPRLVDNPHTWLSATDIVMVDPIGTGFSRPAPGVEGGKFWGTHEDARSVAEFIRLYLTENDRWLSPIYIAGESYGGIRGALLALELQSNRQISLDINGLIYISPALDMRHVFVGDHDALGMALYFPTYCTTAWFHHRVAPAYQTDFSLLEKAARDFALGDYLPALLQGSGLSETRMLKLAKQMSDLSGLPVSFLLRQKLRITPGEFRNELLKDRRITVDRLDARFPTGTYDLTQTLSPLINHYLRVELGYRTQRPYTNTAILFNRWNWDPFSLSVLPQLAETVNRNPHLKIFCAAGYYDFACPYFVIDHCLNQLQLDEGLDQNITRRCYRAGHMVYNSEPELIRFNRAVIEFIRSTSRRESP